HSLLYLASINQQANAITRVQCDLSQGEAGIDGEIKFAQLAHAGPQKPASIDYQPDRLASFHLKEPADKFSAAGRCRPADIAEFIALAKFPQAFKFTAHSALPHQPLFQLDLAGTVQENVLASGFFQIGKHAY